MSKKRIAVVYARYSSHRQGEQSIEGQLAEAYKYAAAHGLTIIKEYCDRAMTGRNDNREQFQEMLKDTAKKQFDTIILWKIDRFGRNREEIAFNKYRCKKNGVKVVYVAESIPDSPEGVILESVLEGMAEYYSLQLSQNILRGQRASAEKCQSTGGNRPLGYKTDPATKKFVIDPETAPTVRLIFDMYAKGSTVTEIVTELNNRGLRTLRGGKFTKNSLHSMLKNEKYIGIYTYKDDLRIEGGVPAIIDVETFATIKNASISYKEPSKFPEIEIDLSFMTEKFAPVAKAIENTKCELIKSVSVTDIYTDDNGKSITTKLVFSHPERTLTKEEVLKVTDSIIAELGEQGINLKNAINL